MKKLGDILGSGLFTGYIPYAPGTFGSLAALIIYLIIPGFSETFIMIPVIIVSFIIGVKLGNDFELKFGKDPKQFTFDEFVGMWIVLISVPNSFLWIVASFIVWRALDIIKPFPANKVESLDGGIGIMLDDVVSGMYSLIIIYIFKIIIY